MSSRLGQRIAEIAFPEAETLAARVIRRYHTDSGRPGAVRPRRRRLVPAAATALLVLGAIVAGTAFGPALANAPVISPVVAKLVLGLTGRSAGNDHVTVLTGSSESAGQTLSVAAGFADSAETVIVLHVSGSGFEPIGPTLVDGSGASLRPQGAVPGPQGNTLLLFGPLAHPASGGTTLTLHVDALADFAAGKGPGAGPLPQVHGDWTMRFILPYENDAAPAPAPGQLGRVTVTFTYVGTPSSGIHVRFVTTGATLGELFDLPATALGGSPFRYELLDPEGRPVADLADSNPSGKGPGSEGSTRVEWDTLYARGLPGMYHLVMTWNGSRLVRDIQVR